MNRFKFQKKEYFKIPVSQLRGDQAITFPLYVYMEMNANMILRYGPTAIPKKSELDKYASRGLEFFACPVDYLAAWTLYANAKSAGAKAGAAAASGAMVGTSAQNANSAGVAGGKPRELSNSRFEADLKNLDLDAPEKRREALAQVGEKMLRSLSDIAIGDHSKKWAAIKECQTATDRIVQIGLQTHKSKTAYQDLIELSQPDLEHASCVATIAVIFALNAGVTEYGDLVEISMAGLLHDVGMGLLPPHVAKKPVQQLDAKEYKLMAEHPLEGAQIIEDFGDELSQLIKLTVLQHHERFDGMGYPKKLRGMEIDSRVQIVSLADLVADYMRGQITGEPMSPEKAFEMIIVRQKSHNEQIVNPQILEPVHRVILETKLSPPKPTGAVA